MTFDEKAKDWDKNLVIVQRAIVIAKEIKEFIPIKPTMKALEFGCGTGLVSFNLKDDFKSITLTDTSKGMLEVLDAKIKAENITHLTPLLIDLVEDKYISEDEKFDVIYTSMTLHHILDIDKVMAKFNALLNKNGYLCIADLDKEDSSFHAHDPDFIGHHGFERIQMENYFKNHGFQVCMYKICFEIEKTFDNNIVKKYPVFLIIGKKL